MLKGWDVPVKVERVKYHCDTCGKILSLIPSIANNGCKHFCKATDGGKNSECKIKWHSRKMSGENNPRYSRVKVKCDYCGKPKFIRQYRTKNKRHFCKATDGGWHSECLKKWVSENTSGENSHLYTRVEVFCEQCGEPKMVKSYIAKKEKKHFCNPIAGSQHSECWLKWMSENQVGEKSSGWKGGGVKVRCAWCGKSKMVKAHLVKSMKNHFCNRKHQGKWKSENDVGENNPRWLGGVSFEPYPTSFNSTLKRTIRKRDKYTCQQSQCSATEASTGIRMSIHHIDYDKDNSNKNNLICLCAPCHGKTNHNREQWTTLFQSQILGGKT